MESYQERVIAERDQLQDRMDKLASFLLGEKIKILSEEEQELLQEQLIAMGTYQRILNRRIDGFR